MEQRTIYVSDDGIQFESAEDCERYELLSAFISELEIQKDNCELPEDLASDPIAVASFLRVLAERFRGPHRVARPKDLASAVRILIALADHFRDLSGQRL
jgi:hypothetical protein